MLEVYLKIYGVVQGVNFRSDAQKQARSLGLSGWVRNLPDGTVEVVAQGKKDDLEKLVAWAQTGPDSAEVKKVDVSFREPSGQYSGFEVRY